MNNLKKQKIKKDETLLLPDKIINKGVIYKDPYKNIEKIIAKFPDFNKEFYVSDFGPKVALLLFKGNKILLTRQYRLLINDLSYEIPGGKVDNKENLKEAAIRECFEETGVKSSKLKKLISYDPDLEYTKNHTTVYYSNTINEISNCKDNKSKWIKFKKCLKMIQNGKIRDSLSIISIFAYFVKIKQL